VFMVGILLKRPLSMQRNMVEFFSCLLVMMLISLQPILAGPAVTGYPKGSGTRLGAMGIVAIMTALAMVMKHCDLERIFKENRIFWIASIVILAFNSFHHLYSWVLPFSMERFILFNFISAFAIGAMWFKVITVKPA